MRKLLMGTWLLAIPTAYAAEQDKRLSNWAGSKKMFAYASALAHALDLLVIGITHDIYAHHALKHGLECDVSGGDTDAEDGTLDTRTITTTCHLSSFSANHINASLVSSYWQTIKTAQELERKARSMYGRLLIYEERPELSQEAYNRIEACNALTTHRSLVSDGYYNDFVDRYNTEHAAFKDKMRKNIIKVYFYAVKRAYGTYAAYMNRIAKRIKKEHNCEM